MLDMRVVRERARSPNSPLKKTEFWKKISIEIDHTWNIWNVLKYIFLYWTK